MVILIGKSIEKYFVSEEEANTFDLFVKSEQISKQVINILLFEVSTKMPSIPQGAFAACKIREHINKKSKNDNGNGNQMKNNNNQIAKMKFNEMPDPNKYFCNKELMKYLPVKYNEKFMNAIWGHYNHYSPHNIKSNDTASNSGKIIAVQHQQQ